MHISETPRSTIRPVEPNGRAVWLLIGKLGEGQPVRKHPVNSAQTVIGRRADADLSLSFSSVSKNHAQLRVTTQGCFVRDLGSTNGTYVNGQRTDVETALLPGDLVQFANAAFQMACEAVGEGAHTQAAVVMDKAVTLLQFERLMSERAVTPFFQPIVRIDAGETIGFEVLARSRFVGLRTAHELFEAAALVIQEIALSRLMRAEGVRTGRLMLGQTRLFLNTHPSELDDPHLVASLRELRRGAGDLPITLEIHEAGVTNPRRMGEFRSALSDLDIKLAYDDFGSGQARLVELVEVPPDFLKFDRSLVQGIDTAPLYRQQALSSLLEMARNLGITSVAEGIESEAEGSVCRQIGFELAQGYFYGKPAPAARWRH